MTPPSAPAPATRQFRGAIDRVDGTNRIIVVSGTQVSVPASAAIRNASGATIAFSDLRVGDAVSVTATVTAGAVTATTIVVESAAPPASTVTLAGRVAAVSGTCPALTFAVADTTVTTTASTSVAGGSCGQIVNGAIVQVTGTRQADRSVTASQVVIRP